MVYLAMPVFVMLGKVLDFYAHLAKLCFPLSVTIFRPMNERVLPIHFQPYEPLSSALFGSFN